MSKHQLRLLLCAGGALGLILVSALVLPWFRIRFTGFDTGVSRMRIDLRSFTMCSPEGVCDSVPFSKFRGLYPTMSGATFWTSLALCAMVLYQTACRLLGGTASTGVNRIGFLFGMLCFAVAGATAYLFIPETEAAGDMATIVTRSWAPVMMFGGDLLAMVALYFAVAPELTNDDVGDGKLPTAIARLPATPLTNRQLSPVEEAPRRPSSIPLERTSAPNLPQPTPNPRTKAPSSIPFAVDAGPPPDLDPGPSGAAEHPLRGTLAYATATAEISRAGIDAHRETGVSKLVMWSDIVGIVARRLPAEAPYDGETFVDVVSTAGSTLRFLPWTRLTGEPLEGVGEELARALVQLLASHCPDAQLDAATRTFLGGHGHAAQLPDAATLAQHDERLA